MLRFKNYLSKRFYFLKDLIQFLGIKPSGLPNWRKLIGKNQSKFLSLKKNNKNILVCTSGGSHKVVNIFNSLLAFILRFKESNVEFFLCDKILPGCQMSSMDFVDTKTFIKDGPKKLCRHCKLTGESIFEGLGLKINYYSKFLINEDYIKAEEILNNIKDFSNIRQFKVDEINIGEHALAGALRYFTVGDLKCIDPEISLPILKRYVKAAILVKIASEKILITNNVDIVILDHGLYVPNGIILSVAKKNKIKTIAYNTSYRKKTILFSRDETYHKTFINEDEKLWKNIDLNSEVKKKIDDYLYSRRHGTNDWEFYYQKPDFNLNNFKEKNDLKKTVVTFMTNTIWDAQLEFPSNIFKDMVECIIETIKYFKNREDVTFLIRVHPAEVNHDRPSNQKIADEIKKVFPNLPKNIKIIAPEDPLSSYSLAEISDCVIIYGSKIGLEIAAMGIPVIVAGEAWLSNKDITLKPSSQNEYFDILKKIPLNKKLSASQIILAKKFAYHFFFRRMIEIKSLEYFSAKWPPYKINKNIYDIVENKKDKAIELISNKIIHDEEIIYNDENYIN